MFMRLFCVRKLLASQQNYRFVWRLALAIYVSLVYDGLTLLRAVKPTFQLYRLFQGNCVETDLMATFTAINR